jgi:APA family basic amino acid/polyamine antiporter
MPLKRQFGVWDIFCIASGAMISSGLFVLPGLAFAQAGPAVIFSYAIAGLLFVPSSLCLAELATAMPKSGGNYFFIERGIGGPVGTFAGLANWLADALKAAFALIGIGASLSLIMPDVGIWHVKLTAIGSAAIFVAINCVSVKTVGRLQVILVVLLLAAVILYIIAGYALARPTHQPFAGFFNAGPRSVFATSGMVFISYLGLNMVANVAGEVRDPRRSIPIGMISALVIVTVLYVLAVYVTINIMAPEDLSHSLTPLASAAGIIFGPLGAAIIGSASLIAFVTTANGGILSASRHPMAMSEDGQLPPALARVSPRFSTPIGSVLLTGVFIVAVIAFLTVEELVKVASTMMLVLFVLVNTAVIIMRGSKLQNYRPLFRAPLHPYLPIAGIIAYVFLIADMGAIPLMTTAAFAVAAAGWYFVYARRHQERESALMYLVRRAISREMYRSSLDEDLKQIAIERDDIIHDRFDNIIRGCAVLDVEGPIESDDMFAQVASVLSPRLGMSQERLFELFVEREHQSSTVVEPGLAIPHVIVPGENIFDVLLLRSRSGVRFPAQDKPVNVVFVLIGSADQRNYHLRALMAVAHIVQEHDFIDRWLKAPAGEHLRDIILLSRRKRDET